MRSKILLLSAIVFQIAIVVVMIAQAMRPLVTGTEVVLSTVAYDPRDILMGDYVDLRYPFSGVNMDLVAHDSIDELLPGDVVYVELKPDSTGTQKAGGLWKEVHPNTICMRGIVAYPWSKTYKGHVNLRFGIEQYYSDPDEAKRLGFRQRGSATNPMKVAVMVDSDGRSRIKRIIE